MSVVTTKMKLVASETKSRNVNAKSTTNIEKKTKEKVAKMTSNDTLTMAFVLKNRKLLKDIKNCKVKLSKTIKNNAINKRVRVKLSKKLSRKLINKKGKLKPPSTSESTKSTKNIKLPTTIEEKKRDTPQKEFESKKKDTPQKERKPKKKDTPRKERESKKKTPPRKESESQKELELQSDREPEKEDSSRKKSESQKEHELQKESKPQKKGSRQNSPQKERETQKKSHKESEHQKKASTQKAKEPKKKVPSPKGNEQQKKSSPPNRNSHSPGPIFIRLPSNRTIRKTNKRQTKALSKIVHLTEKFGKKMFRCHVRVKRLKKSNPLFKKKLNINRKTVSFMDTVEVFGESDMESEMNESRDRDQDTTDGVNKKVPRTSTPIIDILRRNNTKARRNINGDTNCVEKLTRKSNRLSSSVDEEMADATGIKEENIINGSKSAAESTRLMQDDESCNDRTVQEVHGDETKSGGGVAMDIDDSENKDNAAGDLKPDDKENNMVLEAEDDSKVDKAKSEDTYDTKKMDVSHNSSAESATNGKSLDNEAPNLDKSAPTIDINDSFHSADDHDINHAAAMTLIKNEISNSLEKIVDKEDTNLEQKAITINKSTPEKHAIQIYSSTTNKSNPLLTSTDDLFDLLKSNQLPLDLLASPKKAPSELENELKLSDNEDEDITEPLQSNISGTDNKDSKSTENKDSRFSLNTFFKKIKEKCSPSRSENNVNKSNASEVNLNDTEQNDTSALLFDEAITKATGPEIITQ